MAHFGMNKQRSAHMDGKQFGKEEPAAPAGDVKQESGQHHAPDIHINSHDKGHTVTIMHRDGRSEPHEHAKGDAEGIKAHIDQHIGGAPGQDHGGSSNEGDDEYGLGGAAV